MELLRFDRSKKVRIARPLEPTGVKDPGFVCLIGLDYQIAVDKPLKYNWVALRLKKEEKEEVETRGGAEGKLQQGTKTLLSLRTFLLMSLFVVIAYVVVNNIDAIVIFIVFTQEHIKASGYAVIGTATECGRLHLSVSPSTEDRVIKRKVRCPYVKKYSCRYDIGNIYKSHEKWNTTERW